MTDGPTMRGRLLVAAPALREPTFHRTVILLLDHGPNGALGVVLNRPSTVEVGVVLPEWHAHVTEPPVLFLGGPVGQDTAMGIAVLAAGASGSPDVDAMIGPFGLVDLDAVPETVESRVRGVRVFAGYAGWSPGQLAAEFAEGAWACVPGLPGDVLSQMAGPRLWRAVMGRQTGRLAVLATAPADPTVN